MPAESDELGLRKLALRFDTMADAWASSDDDALCTWLIARFVTAEAEARVAVATALACVRTCIGGIPDTLPVFGVLPVVQAWAERSAVHDDADAVDDLRLARDAVACSEALLEAMRSAQDRARLRTKHPSVPTLKLELRFANRLAGAVRSAQAAFGTRTERLGGVRARTPDVGRILRARYRLVGDRIVSVPAADA
ncbi:hypothetical protein BE04_26015 [Sorangium cellulosum]|uniref:Uncharacterized protein n=1 Tax=Sorangium cellulosum TaxID=56 RepID=A0A150PXJ9_SORCE|nr:hypothetical protein BE04_26015 [Sorangium cellulosum]